jgi:hypothetical protein
MLPWLLAALVALGQFGQANTGELRVTVTDATGAPLPGPIEIGVSFPIAFDRANIYGAEAKFEIPSVEEPVRVPGLFALAGVGQLPVTGGLFLGEDTEELESQEFPPRWTLPGSSRSRSQRRVRFGCRQKCATSPTAST